MYKLTNKVPTESGHYWIENFMGRRVVVRVTFHNDDAVCVDYPGSEAVCHLYDFSLWSEKIEEPEG